MEKVPPSLILSLFVSVKDKCSPDWEEKNKARSIDFSFVNLSEIFAPKILLPDYSYKMY